MYSAALTGPETGAPADFHLAHLASPAASGAGLVMAEATGVRPDGRTSPWDLGLWNDHQQEAFSRITAAIKAHGAVPAVQLAHAGRKASVDKPWLSDRCVPESEGGWQTVAPSAVAYDDLPVPHELTVAEIQQLVADFADFAKRALAAGFQVAEVHGAHGYLINSFLSPVSDHRTTPTAAASRTGSASPWRSSTRWASAVRRRSEVRAPMRTMRASVSFPPSCRSSSAPRPPTG